MLKTCVCVCVRLSLCCRKQWLIQESGHPSTSYVLLLSSLPVEAQWVFDQVCFGMLCSCRREVWISLGSYLLPVRLFPCSADGLARSCQRTLAVLNAQLFCCRLSGCYCRIRWDELVPVGVSAMKRSATWPSSCRSRDLMFMKAIAAVYRYSSLVSPNCTSRVSSAACLQVWVFFLSFF